LLEQLADSKADVDVNQGFDARLLTKNVIERMNKIKISVVHFAWDNPKDEIVKEKLLLFNEHSKIQGKAAYVKKKVYCLTNYWSTFEQDLYRVYWLRDNGYDPYVMIFNKDKAPKKLRYLQRWVNNKLIFRSCERFEDYEFCKKESAFFSKSRRKGNAARTAI
jgi:hypothetical protein